MTRGAGNGVGPVLNRRPEAHELASLTYLRARKPESRP